MNDVIDFDELRKNLESIFSKMEKDIKVEKMAEIGKIIWKTIPGTCGIYEVSNFGEIRNRTTGKPLHISKNSKGYAIVSLNKSLYKVHKIVGECFVQKPVTTEKLQIDHIDRNRMNNDSRNLRWVTTSDNRKNQKVRNKYRTHKGKLIKRICMKTGEKVIFETLTKAAASLGMGLATIWERLASETPTKSGYKFVYVDKELKNAGK